MKTNILKKQLHKVKSLKKDSASKNPTRNSKATMPLSGNHNNTVFTTNENIPMEKYSRLKSTDRSRQKRVKNTSSASNSKHYKGVSEHVKVRKLPFWGLEES